MLLIIDNQSSFIKKFRLNLLSEQNIEYRYIDHNEPLIIGKTGHTDDPCTVKDEQSHFHQIYKPLFIDIERFTSR